MNGIIRIGCGQNIHNFLERSRASANKYSPNLHLLIQTLTLITFAYIEDQNRVLYVLQKLFNIFPFICGRPIKWSIQFCNLLRRQLCKLSWSLEGQTTSFSLLKDALTSCREHFKEFCSGNQYISIFISLIRAHLLFC